MVFQLKKNNSVNNQYENPTEKESYRLIVTVN